MGLRRISFSAALVLFVTGCTAPTPPSPFAPGKAIFSFDPALATELEISRHDPKPGSTNDQAWTARFLKQTDSEGQADWTVASAPGGRILADHQADGVFIDHLIDTLRTLVWRDYAPNGPPDSFGLSVPEFALRWKVADHTFELRIGNATVDDGAFIQAGDVPTIGIAQGAALQMLSYLDSFDTLRRRTLLTWTPDAVNELSLYQGGHLVFYARRGTAAWTDRQVGDYLSALTHLRVDTFVDDPKIIATRWPELGSYPLFRVVFKSRLGRKSELRVSPDGSGKLLARVSTRPNSLFLLPTQAIIHLEAPRTRTKKR